MEPEPEESGNTVEDGGSVKGEQVEEARAPEAGHVRASHLEGRRIYFGIFFLGIFFGLGARAVSGLSVP